MPDFCVCCHYVKRDKFFGQREEDRDLPQETLVKGG